VPGGLIVEHISAAHRELIAASAISGVVRDARGYRTVVSKTELSELQFKGVQALPGLLHPIWNVHGENGSNQLRPDEPRVDNKGRAIKYETPRGTGMLLDVHPHARELLADPRVELWIPEGIRKADALLTAGAPCVIALLGVFNWRGKNSMGGLTALADWESVALNNRVANLVFDSDVSTNRQVRNAITRFGAWLKQRGANVRLVELPGGPNGEKVGADDYVAAGHDLTDLRALIVERFSTIPVLSGAKDGARSRLIVVGQLRDQVRQAVSTLVKVNDPPCLFVRGGELVRIGADEEQRPVIQRLSEASLRHELNRAADYYQVRGDAPPQEVAPPVDTVRDILGTPPIGQLPPLRGIVEAPVLRPDGTIHAKPGYDAATRLFYAPADGLDVPNIPENPSDTDVRTAVGLLDDLLADFPFDDDAGRANTVAAMLTSVVRPAISGCTPLALFDSPQQGTGKSLLADVVAIIVTGRAAGTMIAPKTEEEWRKQITAALVRGSAVIKSDNVRTTLNSAVLSAALTADTWTDRVLGSNTTSVSLPQRALWIATGNNLHVGGDNGRRCYWVRIDPKLARPWERGGFRHPHLVEFVSTHRGQLLAALLTLTRAWWAAGCPAAENPVIGSFEPWCRTIGGILAHAGIIGFLDNLEALYERADEETAEWATFLRACLDRFAAAPFTVAQLHLELTDGNLRDAAPGSLSGALETKPGGVRIRIGQALAARAERRYDTDGLRVERVSRDSRSKKAAEWAIRTDTPPTPRSDGGSRGSQTFPAHAGAQAGAYTHTRAGLRDHAGAEGENTPPTPPNRTEVD